MLVSIALGTTGNYELEVLGVILGDAIQLPKVSRGIIFLKSAAVFLLLQQALKPGYNV